MTIEMVTVRSVHWRMGQTYQVYPKSPLVTPKSETRSEISVKFGIYKGKVENFRARCLPPLYIYTSAVYLPLYIGEVNSGKDIFNFNLVYTKFYADFRSGLRFGCYTSGLFGEV